jgi:hypothetical protein
MTNDERNANENYTVGGYLQNRKLAGYIFSRRPTSTSSIANI